jgi:hypothetical protein
VSSVARDYDAQLLESVAVRRRRLRDALSWGSLRTKRSMTDNVFRLLIGAAVAAAVCAGCVGWAFLQAQLEKQERERQQRSAAVVAEPVVRGLP